MNGIHNIELQWIKHLQDWLRNPVMDVFFLGWNFVDTFFSMILIITIAWFLINQRIGIRLLLAFLLSSIINGLLKKAFLLPRPSHIDPSVAILNFSSFGFPSGAAQTAAIIMGVFLIETKNKLYWLLSFLFCFFLCLSRVYLGVHFFTDILGGLFVGSCIMAIYYIFSKLTRSQEIVLCLIFSVMLLIIDSAKFVVQGGILAGVTVGLIIGNRETSRQNWPFRLFEGIIAMGGLLIFSELKDIYTDWKLLFTFLEGFWFSYLGGEVYRTMLRIWIWATGKLSRLEKL